MAPLKKGRKNKKKQKQYKRTADRSKASTVQVLVTVFWHMTAGLPLRWMTSASNGSERRNAAEMLNDLPRNARLIGDAKYVGYPLWSKICNSGRSFLVRVGSNRSFLKNLGKYRVADGFVYYWPACEMCLNEPPIVLRLFQIHDGKKAIFLVTNELDMDDETACRNTRTTTESENAQNIKIVTRVEWHSSTAIRESQRFAISPIELHPSWPSCQTHSNAIKHGWWTTWPR